VHSVEIDRRLVITASIIRTMIPLMMELPNKSETSVNFYKTVRGNITKNSSPSSKIFRPYFRLPNIFIFLVHKCTEILCWNTTSPRLCGRATKNILSLGTKWRRMFSFTVHLQSWTYWQWAGWVQSTLLYPISSWYHRPTTVFAWVCSDLFL
jgi:hypothetical protein